MEVTADSWVKFNRDSARWRKVGDTIVVMDLKNSTYFSVEGSVASVWEQLDAGAKLGDLANELVEQFDAEAEQIMADMVTIVDELCARGVVVVS